MKRILEDVLGEYFGTPTRVEVTSSREGTYVSSWSQREVDVRLADGRQLSLLVKSFEPASGAKPDLVVDTRREERIYRDLLPALEGGTPRFYGVAEDGSLVLERVAGTPLWQVGDFTKWLEAARWAGRLHSTFERVPSRSSGLLPYDDAYYRAWPARARENLPEVALLDAVAGDYDAVVRLLLALPTTIIHGEFHASNIIVRDNDDDGGGGICVLDWETAAVGPGLMDLADLTSGGWDADRRGALAEAYFSATDQPTAAPAALAACRLHRALQWLGWSHDWNAPPHHANDWLDEARRAWADFKGSQ
jgi:aminoglycoside phosphotransferase (APT) family kinase protein